MEYRPGAYQEEGQQVACLGAHEGRYQAAASEIWKMCKYLHRRNKLLLHVHPVPSSGPDSGDLEENKTPLGARGDPPKHDPCAAGCQGAREPGDRGGEWGGFFNMAGLSASCRPRNASCIVQPASHH